MMRSIYVTEMRPAAHWSIQTAKKPEYSWATRGVYEKVHYVDINLNHLYSSINYATANDKWSNRAKKVTQKNRIYLSGRLECSRLLDNEELFYKHLKIPLLSCQASGWCTHVRGALFKHRIWFPVVFIISLVHKHIEEKRLKLRR
jgi:hypothetical protein